MSAGYAVRGEVGAPRGLKSLGREPLDGDMFLFVARDRRQARVLFWNGTALVVYAKRLEKGRFNAPWQGDANKPWCLTTSELALLEKSHFRDRVQPV